MSPNPQKPAPVTPAAPSTTSSGDSFERTNVALSNFAEEIVSQRFNERYTLRGDTTTPKPEGQQRLNLLAGFSPVRWPEIKPAPENPDQGQNPNNPNSPSNPTSPETVAQNLNSSTTRYNTNDGKTADINRMAMNDLERLERELVWGNGLGHNPIMVLSEGTGGTKIVIKNWEVETNGKMLNQVLTAEFLAKYNFTIRSVDKNKGTITLDYDLRALTRGKPVELSTRRMFGKIENPLDPSDIAMVYPAVERNFKDMFGSFQWEPAIVSAEKVGQKPDPSTVIIADPDGGYMAGLKKDYYRQAYEYGFIPEAFTHNGKQYVKLKFAPVELSTMTNEQKVQKIVKPATKEISNPRTLQPGWNNTSVYLDSEFQQRLQSFLDDRVGGWQKNINIMGVDWLRRRWEVSSDSPTSVTMKNMSSGDIANLTRNADEAAKKYGITVKVNGSNVTFSFDKAKLKAQTEVVTFDGDEGFDGGYGLFKKHQFWGWSDKVTITQGTLVALRGLAREMKGIGDADANDQFRFDEIKLIHIPSDTHTKVGIEDANGVYKAIFDANPGLAKKYGFKIEEGQKDGKRMYVLTYTGG
jgi:hypothetical protein